MVLEFLAKVVLGLVLMRVVFVVMMKLLNQNIKEKEEVFSFFPLLRPTLLIKLQKVKERHLYVGTLAQN